MKTTTNYLLTTENFCTALTESISDLMRLYEVIKDSYKSIVIYDIENGKVTRITKLK